MFALLPSDAQTLFNEMRDDLNEQRQGEDDASEVDDSAAASEPEQSPAKKPLDELPQHRLVVGPPLHLKSYAGSIAYRASRNVLMAMAMVFGAGRSLQLDEDAAARAGKLLGDGTRLATCVSMGETLHPDDEKTCAPPSLLLRCLQAQTQLR